MNVVQIMLSVREKNEQNSISIGVFIGLFLWTLGNIGAWFFIQKYYYENFYFYIHTCETESGDRYEIYHRENLFEIFLKNNNEETVVISPEGIDKYQIYCIKIDAVKWHGKPPVGVGRMKFRKVLDDWFHVRPNEGALNEITGQVTDDKT